MKPRPHISFATLESLDGASFSLGWPARDARQRLSKRTSWDHWLPVHGEIRCAQGSWRFFDAALTEHEARDLADFLDLRPWTTERRTSFVEPCIAFAALGQTGTTFHLAARFRAEAAPPWIHDDDDARWGRGFTIDMHVTDEGLRRFTRALRASLGLTPDPTTL